MLFLHKKLMVKSFRLKEKTICYVDTMALLLFPSGLFYLDVLSLSSEMQNWLIVVNIIECHVKNFRFLTYIYIEIVTNDKEPEILNES